MVYRAIKLRLYKRKGKVLPSQMRKTINVLNKRRQMQRESAKTTGRTGSEGDLGTSLNSGTVTYKEGAKEKQCDYGVKGMQFKI